jgi:uroporphyrinogen-III synthase
LVHYGERNSALADALEARGAALEELCLYEWVMPDDVEPLRTLVRDLIDGRVDAVAFTSLVQCRHLFQVAADLGKSEDLVDALSSRVVVAAIGPVCAAALNALGVTPRVLPAHPKMGPMIAALADYFELARGDV